MSKMGISTIQSYRGAQIFEAIGLNEDFVDAVLRQDRLADRRHRPGGDRRARRSTTTTAPTPAATSGRSSSSEGGQYQWRRDGEFHLFNPETVFRLQHATQAGRYDIFKKYTRLVDEQNERLCTLRGLFAFKLDKCQPVPIEEVEPVESIVKRFATGAMSYGSISAEAHETLAIAMNRMGGKSQHRRGGRGPRAVQAAAQRRQQAERDQAGRLGPVRRHQRVPRQRRRAPDQDGAGRQAGRGGPAPRPQGLALDRQGPVLDAGRRPDQPAAAPRHLLDRRPRPVDLRPEEQQPAGADQRQARGRGGRRHGRGGRGQGAQRRRPDQRPRRRHRRQPADLAQARRHPLGARPGRDPADARPEQAPRPDRRPDRRPDEDRPRRGDRRAAGRRGVRLRDRAAGRHGLHHDAGLPPRHLPGRHRHPEPEAPREVPRPGRARRQLLPVHRPGSPRADGPARLPHDRRDDRPQRPARHAARRSTTTRPRGLDFSKIFYRPDVGPDVAVRKVDDQDHGLEQSLDWTTLLPGVPAGARAGRAGRRSSCRSATSTARSARSSAAS